MIYKDLIDDLMNTVIVMCQHMRKLLTLLEVYTDMDEEEKFLDDIMKKHGIEGTDDD